MSDWKQRHISETRHYCAEYSALMNAAAADDSHALEYFEIKADLFYHRYGMLAPGKDDPTPRDTDERNGKWSAWCKAAAESDMLARIAKLSRRVEELEEKI